MKRFILSAILVLLSGCGTIVSLTPEKRASIGSLSLESQINKPKTIEFGGRLMELFAPGIGGLSGSLIQSASESVNQPKDQRFTAFLNDSGIDISQIFYEQLDTRLKAHPFFSSRYKENGTYKLRVEISSYSYHPKNTFSNYYKPWVMVTYHINSPSNEIIAKGVASSGAFNNRLPENTLEQVYADPQLLKNAFISAVDFAIEDILDQLMK